MTPANPPENAGLFITGTDTGVGKTYVAAALIRHLRRHGHLVSASKPVATGAKDVGGRYVSEDTLHLAEAAGTPVHEVTPWSFPEELAPPVAAKGHGVSLDLKQLAEAARAAQRAKHLLIVEGVGGLLCPLTERETVADLARELRLPLVIVARRALGTLNHSLLTVAEALRRGLPVAGVVVNETTKPNSLAEETNVEELACRLTVPLLAVTPFGFGTSCSSPLEAVDWFSLCRSALSAK